MRAVSAFAVCLLITGLAGAAVDRSRAQVSAGHAKDVICGQTGQLSCGSSTTGRLMSGEDCALLLDGEPDGTVVDRYQFSANAGDDVIVSLTSSDFDPFLFVLSPDGSTLQLDDDGGTGLNALVEATTPATGNYTIFANNAIADDEGNYALSLDCSSTPPPEGFPVDASISGSWFDPGRDGEGWKMEILPDGAAVVYWFTYPPSGAAGEQAWIIGVGEVSGNQVIFEDAVITRGTRFGSGFNANAVIRETWGDMTFTFDDRDSGRLDYAGTGSFGSGTIDIQRITNLSGINGGGNGARNVGAGISGSWFDDSRSGEGWIIEVISSTSALVYWFTYDQNRNQAWNIGIGTLSGNQITVSEPVDAVGTVFGAGFNAANVNRRPWGSYVFSFDSCNAGSITYLSQRGLGSDTYPISRLTSLAGHVCRDFTDVSAAANTVAVNPGDPLVVSSARDDGVIAQFFGTKNADGTPSTVDKVVVKGGEAGGTEPVLEVGELDEPQRVTDRESGNSVTVAPTDTPGEVIVSGLTKDGELQSILRANLAELFGPGGKSINMDDVSERGGTARVWSTSIPEPDPISAKGSASQATFSVRQCGAPADDVVVNLEVKSTSGDTLFDLPGRRVDNGVFTVDIPTRATSNTSVSSSSVCNGFVNRVANGCAVSDMAEPVELTRLCNLLATTMVGDDSSDAERKLAVDFFSSCSQSLVQVKRGCVAAGGNAQDRNDFVCGNVSATVDRALENLVDQVDLEPRVSILGSFSADVGLVDNQIYDSAGPFPNYEVDVAGDPSIVSFFTTPIDPAPDQQYDAIADVTCVTPNTPVTISITGTDGFFDMGTCNISGSGRCGFTIPGAAAGVRDTIVVSIQGGPRREILVIF